MKAIKDKNKKNTIKTPDNDGGFYKKHPYFSLRYIDKTNKKFSFKYLEKTDLSELLLDLNELSQRTWEEIKNAGKYYRFHNIGINDTKEAEHLYELLDKCNMTEEEKDQIIFYQFQPNKKSNYKLFRIDGFFNNDNVF